MTLRPILIGRFILIAAGALLVTGVVREGLINNASRVPPIFATAVALSIEAPTIDELAAQNFIKIASQNAASDNSLSGLLLLNSDSLQRAELKARSALSADILRVDSLAIVGLALHARGEQSKALQVFDATSELSRRNLFTRIFFMEHFARQGQIAPMFREIDLALRTSASAQNLMFPILAAALSEPEVIPQVAALLNAEPDWASSFVYHAITSSTSAEKIAEAYLSSNIPYSHSGVDLTRLLIETLIAQQQFNAAFRVADEFAQGVNTRVLIAEPDFIDSGNSIPFAWDLLNSTDFETVRTRDERGRGALGIHIFGPVNDVVARQLLRLSAGRYTFSNQLGETTGTGVRMSAEWRLRCASDGSQIGQLNLRQNTIAEWNIPQSCPYQWLELNIGASEVDANKSRSITPVMLSRADN